MSSRMGLLGIAPDAEEVTRDQGRHDAPRGAVEDGHVVEMHGQDNGPNQTDDQTDSDHDAQQDVAFHDSSPPGTRWLSTAEVPGVLYQLATGSMSTSHSRGVCQASRSGS